MSRPKNIRPKNTEQTFWNRVDRNAPNGCWEWTGALTRAGYGLIRWERQAKYTHRLSYELSKGPIPEDKHVCHSCDNPACVNPDHLWLGSNYENVKDKVSKGRWRRPESAYKKDYTVKPRLTKSQVLEIRKDTRSVEIIASDYGVTKDNIYHILARRTWKQI